MVRVTHGETTFPNREGMGYMIEFRDVFPYTRDSFVLETMTEAMRYDYSDHPMNYLVDARHESDDVGMMGARGKRFLKKHEVIAQLRAAIETAFNQTVDAGALDWNLTLDPYLPDDPQLITGAASLPWDWIMHPRPAREGVTWPWRFDKGVMGPLADRYEQHPVYQQDPVYLRYYTGGIDVQIVMRSPVANVRNAIRNLSGSAPRPPDLQIKFAPYSWMLKQLEEAAEGSRVDAFARRLADIVLGTPHGAPGPAGGILGPRWQATAIGEDGVGGPTIYTLKPSVKRTRVPWEVVMSDPSDGAENEARAKLAAKVRASNTPEARHARNDD